ncbi:MAG: uracil phosphoribosyltransferase [Arcobacteraceae bacterium]
MILQSNNTLIKHLVNQLRNAQTNCGEFRTLVAQIAKLLCAEALENMPTVQTTIPTWQGDLKCHVIEENDLVFIPILRAGEPMLNGILELLPKSMGGFLAMKRDEETAVSKIYYQRFPNLNNKTVILLDPMVATGGSLIDAISVVKEQNPKEVICLNILGSTFGVDSVDATYPNIKMYIAQIDDELDENKYIRPGLGDAGDRAFNTL